MSATGQDYQSVGRGDFQTDSALSISIPNAQLYCPSYSCIKHGQIGTSIMTLTMPDFHRTYCFRCYAEMLERNGVQVAHLTRLMIDNLST